MDTKKNQQIMFSRLPLWFAGLLGISVLYVFSMHISLNVGFVLLLLACALLFYWIPVISNTLNRSMPGNKQPATAAKTFLYDLIPVENGFLFVADVPGPEEKIHAELKNGRIDIAAPGGFSKEIIVPDSEMMKITMFKYRNGVLTLQLTHVEKAG